MPADAIVSRLEESGSDLKEPRAHLDAVHFAMRASMARREILQTHAYWMGAVQRRLQKRWTVRAVASLDPDAFYRDYYSQNRPVLIERAFDPGRWTWTFERLRDVYGGEEVEVMRGKTRDHYYVTPDRYKVRTGLRAFIDEILTTETNELYLTGHNRAVVGRLGEVLDDFQPLPEITGGGSPRSFTSLWMGPRGALSPLHYDKSNVIMVELLGVKRVFLISPYDECFLYHDDKRVYSPVDPRSPDLERFPLYRFARVHEVLVPPGAALFIPVAWWHCVESVTPTFSASMRKFTRPNDFPANLF
jgi:hypothetical protein